MEVDSLAIDGTEAELAGLLIIIRTDYAAPDGAARLVRLLS